MSSSREPESGFLQLSAGRFHYLEWPKAGAPTLVLLHGLTSWAGAWREFADKMTDSYRIIALDQRGHGDSDWAPIYSPESMAEDLTEAVEALGLTRFALAGHSMGAINAWTF